jgi:outer membrane autotransporter protein
VSTRLSYAGDDARRDPTHSAFAPATTPDLAVWMRGYGAWLKSDGDGNAAGTRQRLGGVLFGADAPVGDAATRLGVLFGYGAGSVTSRDRGSSADTDDYHLGLYGGRQWGTLGLRFGSALTLRDADTTRTATFPGFTTTMNGRQRLLTSQTFGELGVATRFGGVSLEPFAAAAYVHVEGLSDHESGTAALNILDNNADVGFTTLGARIGSDITTGAMPLSVRAMLGWRHAFGDVTPEVRQAFDAGSAFTVAGTPIAEDAVVAEAGFDLRFSPTGVLGFSYIGQFGDGTTDQSGRIDLRWAF